jgi:alcohol dehydrogenase class IV
MYARLYQGVFRVVSKFLPWREPVLIEGVNSILDLSAAIKNEGLDKVILVTDQVIESLGLMKGLLATFDEDGIACVIYNKTVPNPTIDNIEEALALYLREECEGIVAFGGGSAIDCAKGIGARVAKPGKSVPQLKGVLKIMKKTPLIFAVPTTAGTGSEATIAAVVSDPGTHEKYAINDPSLIPDYAVLDPALTLGLPKQMTATTGMDALTHAVEAYIGRSNTRETLKLSRDAVKLIFENIETAYADGSDLLARENMLKASYYAGVSFTRAYIGYVHAIAHTLGGFYGIPHGLANAVILPYVLDYYGDAVHRPLAELADFAGLSMPEDSQAEKSDRFIRRIRDLNDRMDIPKKISGIQEKDIPLLVKRAYDESNPLYPVPRILSKKDLTVLYRMIMD